jgi:hypothetical protein
MTCKSPKTLDFKGEEQSRGAAGGDEAKVVFIFKEI